MSISGIAAGDTGRATVAAPEQANTFAPAPSMAALARAALAEAGDDTKLATELLASQLEDAAIRKFLARSAVDMAAASAIGSIRAYERVAIEQGRQVAKVLAQAGAVQRSMYDWPLPFGGTLGNATRDELERAISHYQKAAGTMQRRASFLSRVIDATPPGRKVRDAVSEDQLKEWNNG